MTKAITKLVEKFSRNIDEYKNPKYNETSVRIEFVNPFWEALGWDVHNKSGYAMAFRDVIHEDEVRVGHTTKAPDYSFRIGGKRIFFLETKKPSVDLKHDPAPAFQLRRYAYSAKLPVSLLTDFEEFIVYDTRLKPSISDKPHVGRMLYFTFEDYIEQWEFFRSVFSKEAVLRGDFDRYIQDKRGKKPRAEIDRDFLNDLDSLRILLARNIALRNPDLSGRELNFAVQMTIDRLIFLRMCEDRGIEIQHTLQSLLNGERVYSRLVEIYYRADERYNSGLFHFSAKDGDNPDIITPTLSIDDKLLKDIIKKLYYPDCPYEFSVLPVEVLGNAYEQFLGKRISLTAGHHARIEEKPEVRKAGGVYYTPKYIVDYIVKNTVGKLLENSTPKNVSKLHFLDPACGSGSFLLGAFQYLMDWHLDCHQKDYEKTGKIPVSPQAGGKRALKSGPQAIFQGKGGEWFLSTYEKKRILLNNLYGVDIDANAVEVTKLSLLLKVLENENSETLTRQMGIWHERALPNLSDNIKCGNSLIAPDYYDSQQTVLFDEEEALRINVFDWQTEFKEVFANGGFDAVIGNPPYIPIEMMDNYQKEYFQKHFPQLERKYDSSIVFILASLVKINPNGRLGFISSITWQTGENYAKLRAFLFNTAGVLNLINLPFNVFKDAYVDTGIYILSGKPTEKYSIHCFPKKEHNPNLKTIKFTEVPISLISPPDFKIVLDPQASMILLRLYGDLRFTTLGNISKSTQGLAGARYSRNSNGDGEMIYPFLEKGQVYRYTMQVEVTSSVDMSDKKSLIPFYIAKPKLLIRRVINRQDRLMVSYMDQRLVFKKDINPFLLTETNMTAYYVLGILNSMLISFLYVRTSSIATKDDFRQTTLAELRRIPIRTINFDDPADKAIHERMVTLVEQMLELRKILSETRDPRSREQLQRRIDATDKQIDKLVYQLYELTEEEIAVVENKK